MKKVSKIIIMCVLITITLSTIIFLNKKEVNHNDMFAIMLETSKGTGKYDYAKDNKWPQSEEYVINMYKTHCEKGSVLRWNNETKKINATVKGTDKCYVYFDLSEYGSEEHPYLIQTIEDLVRLSNEVNNGTTYAGKHFLLTNDLDFQDASDYEDASRTDFKDINGINGDEALITELTTGRGFNPIGTGSDYNFKTFQGIFDGNNKKIENLYINNDINLKSLGLFGGIENASISNLIVSGSINSKTQSDIGGIVGEAIGNIEISNCINKVNVTSPSASYSVGGVIGTYNYGSSNNGKAKVKKSINYGNISGSNNAAGIIGYNGGILTLEDSVNYGVVTNNLGQHAGGLLGRDAFATNSTTIINSHNEGKITKVNATSSFVGGLCGKIYGNIIINDSFNIGNITNNSENPGSKVGGLIGEAKFLHIENSYNKGHIENNKNKNFIASSNIDYDSTGGLVGKLLSDDRQLSPSTIKNSYNLSEGTVTGGMESGGIIGYVFGWSNLSLINVFNNANVEASTDLGRGGCAGGLVGYLANVSKLNIINSYNTGDISAVIDAWASGIVGYVWISESNMINVYNNSNVSSVSNASGILYNIGVDSEYPSKVMFNNGYFYGNVNGQYTNIIATTYNTIQNLYYKNSFNSVPGAILLDENEIKSQSLVNMLNNNIDSINLEEIDEILKDYTLSKWTLGSDGYPTLVNE